jgi:hypothetical protein
VNANGIEINNAYPVSVEINKNTNDLCVITKSDIRMVDLKNGQTKRILANIVKNNDI